jgi:hypothetical protein
MNRPKADLTETREQCTGLAVRKNGFAPDSSMKIIKLFSCSAGDFCKESAP